MWGRSSQVPINYGKLSLRKLKHEVFNHVIPYSHFTCLKRSSIEKGKPRVKVEDRSVRLAIPHWGPGDSTPRDGETTPHPPRDRPPPTPRGRNMSFTSDHICSVSRAKSRHVYPGGKTAIFTSSLQASQFKQWLSVGGGRFRWLTTRVSSASWLNAHIRWNIFRWIRWPPSFKKWYIHMIDPW